jgi:hypothetical protein
MRQGRNPRAAAAPLPGAAANDGCRPSTGLPGDTAAHTQLAPLRSERLPGCADLVPNATARGPTCHEHHRHRSGTSSRSDGRPR